MKKLAIVAFAFVLSASMLAGCRGGIGSTDMTIMPSESTSSNGSTTPGNGSTRGRTGGDRDNQIQDGSAEGRIDRQRN